MTGRIYHKRDDDKVPEEHPQTKKQPKRHVAHRKKGNWLDQIPNVGSLRAFRRLIRRKRRRQHLIIMIWMLLFSVVLLAALIYIR